MSRQVMRIALGAVLAAGAACAGGGDAGAGDAGGTGSTFDVTPMALSFTATQNGALPLHQSIHVHINDASLVYGSGWGGSGFQPSWITEPTFANIPSGSIDFFHEFAITTTALQPGTYSATFVLRTSEQSATWPPPLVEQKTVRITYTVTAP